MNKIRIDVIQQQEQLIREEAQEKEKEVCVCVCVCVCVYGTSGHSYKILDEIIYCIFFNRMSQLPFFHHSLSCGYYLRVAFVCLECPQTSMTAG